MYLVAKISIEIVSSSLLNVCYFDGTKIIIYVIKEVDL